MLRYQIIETAWGPFVAAYSNRGLVGTLLPEAPDRPVEDAILERWPAAKPTRRSDPSVAGLRRSVRDYFAGRQVTFDVPLDLSAWTCFRQAVLQACRRIPYGRLASYADLARAVGRPAAMRAVGSTMAHNPLPLIVPCHRVVRADGSLGGFTCPQGVAMKLRLLKLEGTTLPALQHS